MTSKMMVVAIDVSLVVGWPENDQKGCEIAIGCGDIVDSDRGHDSGHGRSQNENLGEEKLCGWLDPLEVARWHWKMA